ncbi:cyclase [Novosphingobium barchaimii LL02]|uniref:Cyclase n=1 Tax=Novosphingobium barchaimii LL02 TaxID=1114963 RepID=A0A0J7XK07_9SPHN|nr:cyclase family protein [Novosphingobium barchaimii]KMS52027.1 cyclase [Novosphingobium barchaimii LL02]
MTTAMGGAPQAGADRWTVRPDGSNWGDFGPDDQIGRLNLITPERRRAAASEVREGLAFCLSLPLDCPRLPLNPRRFPPERSFSMRGEDPVMNYPYGRAIPGMKETVCDDRVALSLQYSTQWDALCHMGYEFDASSDGEEAVTYYNGFRAEEHVCGPVDYLHGGEAKPGPHGAFALGIERIAETGLQGRGVMVDLFAHVGLEAVPVGYDALMGILEADRVIVEPGDVLCLRTGFDRALLGQYNGGSDAFDPHRCSGLDGFDERLQRWIADSGVAALVSDNEAVEAMPDFVREDAHGARVPLHHLCLFKLGIPLGEMFLLSDLADWLRANGRSRFLFTAPPLRLPGAVGSPVTGVGTV